MSHQGNVIVHGRNEQDFIFTSSRWGGASMAKAAQTALRDTLSETPHPDDFQIFLHNISHDSRIDRPIHKLGNTDTPTIIVDFERREISLRIEHDQTVICSWGFEEFLDQNADSISREYFE